MVVESKLHSLVVWLSRLFCFVLFKFWHFTYFNQVIRFQKASLLWKRHWAFKKRKAMLVRPSVSLCSVPEAHMLVVGPGPLEANL